MGSIHGKIKCRNSRDTVSLKTGRPVYKAGGVYFLALTRSVVQTGTLHENVNNFDT
jgi:hypothetical protein